MNTKTPLRQLAETIAQEAGITTDDAQIFVKELFAIVAEELSCGESVDIPGLGTFTVLAGGDNPLKFIPCREFADEVNAPFAIFQPVEVSDSLTTDELQAVVSDDVTPAEEQSIIQEVTSEPIIEELPEETTIEVSDLEASETEPVPETEPMEIQAAPVETEDMVNVYVPEDEEEFVEYEEEPKSRMGLGFILGFVTGLVVAALVLAAYVIYFTDSPFTILG